MPPTSPPSTSPLTSTSASALPSDIDPERSMSAAKTKKSAGAAGAGRGGRPVRAALVVVVVALVVAAGLSACAPDNSSSSQTTTRPRTPAMLQIVSPTPNQVTGPNVDLKMALEGAMVVSPSQVTGISPTQGHIHVSVDGKLVSMTFGLSQRLSNLSSGTHTVQAEFVASDHRQFANRVVATVVFQVEGGAPAGSTTGTGGATVGTGTSSP